jgi:hypothetical protein
MKKKANESLYREKGGILNPYQIEFYKIEDLTFQFNIITVYQLPEGVDEIYQLDKKWIQIGNVPFTVDRVYGNRIGDSKLVVQICMNCVYHGEGNGPRYENEVKLGEDKEEVHEHNI